MNRLKVITDSTCDLSKSIIKTNDIPIVPLKVTIGGKTYYDGLTIHPEKLYRLVEKEGELPKTSSPTPEEYKDIFQSYIDQGCKVIYIGLSSCISSSYQNACLAAKQFPEGNIYTIDSRNLSTGTGLLVMKAIDYIKEGKDINYITKRLNKDVPLVRTSFIINSLDYLYKGGRCSGLQKFIGNILKYKIMIEVDNGQMGVAARIRGSKTRALDKLLNRVITDLSNIDKTRIFITHSMEEEGANYLYDQLSSRDFFKEIIITTAGSVISAHCGPGTIGILYMDKNNKGG